MKTTKGMFVLFISLLILTVTSMDASGFLGFGDTASWKEEVLLHDGTKIIVKRWQKLKGRHEIGQRPPVGEQSIKFTVPGTGKTITWKDEYSKEIGCSNFNLVALHILNSMPYIITTPRLCLSYNKWGRPNPPYVIFKYDGKDWKRVELSELPAEYKNINLVVETKGEEEKFLSRGMISAEMVKKLNDELTQAEFKTIIRTPLKENDLCPDRVTDGRGKWYGIDWFSNQSSYGACLAQCKKMAFSAEYCPCEKIFKTAVKEK